jgi:predicted transposase YdaD
LYEAGYSHRDVLHLFKFIDWVMILPEGLKQAFWLELKAYEEERKVPYITSVEEIGFERGIQQGRQEGRQEESRSLVMLLLEQRLGQLPDDLHDRLSPLSRTQLEALAIALLNFSTLAELEAWLDCLE